MEEYPICQRCGVCCASTLCRVGKDGDNGICFFLEKTENNIYSCSLLAWSKIKGSDININKGCILRSKIFIFENYEKLALPRLEKRFSCQNWKANFGKS